MPPLNNDDNGEGHRLFLTLDIIKMSIYLTKNKDKFVVYTTQYMNCEETYLDVGPRVIKIINTSRK